MRAMGRRKVIVPTRDGFIRRTHSRCEDCEHRGALANDGHPIYIDGFSLATGCSGCKGTGQVELPDKLRPDPYYTGRG